MMSDLTVLPLPKRFRQVCPLSMLLCIIAAEVIAIFIDADCQKVIISKFC